MAFPGEHIDRFGVPLNLKQFALIGHSVGGHLALACTSFKRRAWVDGPA
jgi:pimeloyl-ACP methyl ester carboxylesterase